MSKEKRKNHDLNQSSFYRLSTKRKLAALLSISQNELREFKYSDRLYSEREIPKKTGGVRLIENPRRNLKLTQARIARLLGRISPPEYLYCPVRGRSYVTNAARHMNRRVIRTLDIKKYFPSTSRDRVYRFFRDVMKCSPDIAEMLANIATYKGHLPTGSPLSPIMAFYAHYDVWEEVARLAETKGAIISLYIDDLTISGDQVSDGLIWEIKKSIHRAGLRYHKEKSFFDTPAEITGVIVCEDRLAIPNRQLLKRHRAAKALQKASTDYERKLLLTQLRGLDGQAHQIRSADRQEQQ